MAAQVAVARPKGCRPMARNIWMRAATLRTTMAADHPIAAPRTPWAR